MTKPSHDTEQERRHENHLVGQVYHLIRANQRLEDQLFRLTKMTEIADILRERRLTRDTFELHPPPLQVPPYAKRAWTRVEELLADLDGRLERAQGQARHRAAEVMQGLVQTATQQEADDLQAAPPGDPVRQQARERTAERVRQLTGEMVRELAGELARELVNDSVKEQVAELRMELGVVRSEAWQADSDWLADVRMRLLAAEQAVAYLREQSRELDALRREKDSIVDGAAQLEQNVEDLWKVLNEKTTHIQRLEKQLTRIWNSLPYRALNFLRGPFRRGSGS